MPNNVITANDAAGLAFVQGQAYRINAQVLETPYPQWDFSDLVFVDTEGNPWAPGVMTYTSDFSGKAEFLSSYAKDMPLADVSQDATLRAFELGGIGYQYNIGEVNTAMNLAGGTLPSRRAGAARMTYQKFMYDLVLTGNDLKGMPGVINNSSVTAASAPADGTGSSTYWVDNAGVGQKTPTQIVRDINKALSGVDDATYGAVVANTLLMPDMAYNYIASTPMGTNSDETILSFVRRTNIYTMKTGQDLKIRAMRELATAATTGATAGDGRLVAYFDDPNFLRLHLPMPHQFLPAYQDGWANFVIPGIFRTGGVEFMATGTAYYLDGISEAPA